MRRMKGHRVDFIRRNTLYAIPSPYGLIRKARRDRYPTPPCCNHALSRRATEVPTPRALAVARMPFPASKSARIAASTSGATSPPPHLPLHPGPCLAGFDALLGHGSLELAEYSQRTLRGYPASH